MKKKKNRIKLLIAMSFCFKRKESVAKAIRRLCCERIDAAQKCLRHQNHLKGVHEVRKEIKKLRAVLRLVRGEIGKKVYRKNTNLLRTVAERLTAMRDAHVKLTAFHELMKHFKSSAKRFSEVENALRRNCREQEQKFLKNDSLRAVKKILQKIEKRIRDLQIESDGWAAISPGLKKSYCRGHETLAALRDEPLPENFHEWRKRVKDLWLQLKLLCPASPQKLRAATDKLESLGNFLGDDHDLFMLAEFVVGKNFNCTETMALEKWICRRQKELRSQALKAGENFYLEKPNRFCNRIGNYWKIWRGKND